jgi:hypothetical protein
VHDRRESVKIDMGDLDGEVTIFNAIISDGNTFSMTIDYTVFKDVLYICSTACSLPLEAKQMQRC